MNLVLICPYLWRLLDVLKPTADPEVFLASCRHAAEFTTSCPELHHIGGTRYIALGNCIPEVKV